MVIRDPIALIFLCCFILCSCTSPKKKEIAVTNPEELPPKLLMPDVKKIWIPPAMKNGGQEWEAGHYLFRIDRGASWSR
jgi:hypothetical protein